MVKFNCSGRFIPKALRIVFTKKDVASRDKCE